MSPLGAIPYNTLVVAAGVAAVGFAAGVIGSLGLLRKRALAGDAAAHATLVGVASAFLVTGRRDLPVLLAGALSACNSGQGTSGGLEKTEITVGIDARAVRDLLQARVHRPPVGLRVAGVGGVGALERHAAGVIPERADLPHVIGAEPQL